MTWLAGWPRVPIKGSGGTYVGGFPYRLVLHTMEGSFDSALEVFRSREVGPHLSYDPVTRRKAQHIDLDHAAYALVHNGIQTNNACAIQVEIAGFAHEAPGWSDTILRNLATDVVGPVLAAKGITTAHPAFYGDNAGFTVASPAGRQRMSDAAWQAFNGICGHQHVPDNSHWDPGGLNIDRLLSFLPGHGLTPTQRLYFWLAARAKAAGKPWLVPHSQVRNAADYIREAQRLLALPGSGIYDDKMRERVLTFQRFESIRQNPKHPLGTIGHASWVALYYNDLVRRR